MVTNTITALKHTEEIQVRVFRLLNITDDGFAFDSSTGDTYTLNRLAQQVLQRLQRGETMQEIADFLVAEFGITQNTAQRDVTDFIQQLNLLGLIGANG